MRGEEAAPESRGEEHVGDFGGAGVGDAAAVRRRADDLQRAGHAVRVAGELHGRRIGQIFALTRNHRLDQARAEHAERPEQPDGAAEDHQAQSEARAVVLLLAPAAGEAQHLDAAAEEQAAEQRDAEDAEEHADHADVQAHVAVEDVAELVPDDRLQLVAAEEIQRAPGDGDGGVLRRVARGEGVDARLVVHHVHARHRHAGGERHLLDDVEQAAFAEVARARENFAPLHRLRHGRAALRELGRLDERGDADEGGDGAHGAQQDLRVRDDLREGVRQERAGRAVHRLGPLLGEEQREPERDDAVDGGDEARDEHGVGHDQPAGSAPGARLLFKKVHGGAALCAARG